MHLPAGRVVMDLGGSLASTVVGSAYAALRGQAPKPDALRAAAEIAACDEIDPSSDIHATADFRRHLAKVLALRALEQACRRAAGKD